MKNDEVGQIYYRQGKETFTVIFEEWENKFPVIFPCQFRPYMV